MSQRALTYCFTLQSPWSYLGHAEMMSVAQRYGLSIAWRPVNLGAIFPESGGLPLAKRHPKRQAYRDIELQRWRSRRGVPLNLKPAHWPLDIGHADRLVIALAERQLDPDPFVRAAFTGIWVEDRDLADPATLAELLDRAGHGRFDLALADAPETRSLYDRNTREALDAGVFGAPTYILGGEPFWGQDRIALLEDALRSDRQPFT